MLTIGRTLATGSPAVELAARDLPSAWAEPMSRVLALDDSPAGTIRWAGYGAGAVALLLGLTAALQAEARLLPWLDGATAHATAEPQEVEVLPEDSPPPAPLEPPPPAEPPPRPDPPARTEPAPTSAPPPSPPPRESPPAQAARVLTEDPAPNEPPDRAADTVVTGRADSFAGGLTSRSAAGRDVVRSPLPGSGPAPVFVSSRALPDRSRRASLGGDGTWDCDFPPEADAAQIDDTYVTMQVDVRADGTPAAIRIVDDPGAGFGRQATQCARARRWAPALDHDGHPVAGAASVRVHFTR